MAWGDWEPVKYDLDQRGCVRQGCPKEHSWTMVVELADDTQHRLPLCALHEAELRMDLKSAGRRRLLHS
jgi:hypothetical protein